MVMEWCDSDLSNYLSDICRALGYDTYEKRL